MADKQMAFVGDVVLLDGVSVSNTAPTPQRKRARACREDTIVIDAHASEVVEVVDIESSGGHSLDVYVPCEICAKRVPFQSYMEHISFHNSSSSSKASREDASACSPASTTNSDRPHTRGVCVPWQAKATSSDRVPCDICGQMVSFCEFAEHAAMHRLPTTRTVSSKAVRCDVCGTLVEPEELADHQAAHKMHQDLVDADLQQSTSEVDVTVQLVDLARKGGTGLPGNKRSISPGDAVLVRWQDGNWYQATLDSVNANGQYLVSWSPPYQGWAAEEAAVDAVIPRTEQSREVCNFDVALAFVKKLKSLSDERVNRAHNTQMEIVYHYTRVENVDKIVENNLRPPGSVNADGTQVSVLNAEAYGRGIYAATDMQFGVHFGCGLKCAFLCLAIPGKIVKTGKLGPNHDCLQHGKMRVYKASEQMLPLFFTDQTHAPRLEKCATEIMELLLVKVMGLQKEAAASVLSLSFNTGCAVEVWETCCWWKATVKKVHADGTYDVAWAAPYASWPIGCRVQASCIRKLKAK